MSGEEMLFPESAYESPVSWQVVLIYEGQPGFSTAVCAGDARDRLAVPITSASPLCPSGDAGRLEVHDP